MALEEELHKLAKEQDVLLTEEEFADILGSLKDVLDAFGKIDQAKADEKPAVHAIDLEERLREDEVKKTVWDPHCNSKEFKAPPIVEEEAQ